MKSKIIIELNYWEAVRLKSLVEDGKQILRHQGRTQRDIDGYTDSDLNSLSECLKTQDSPQYAGSNLFK